MLSKIGKILSKIVFIFCIIGFCGGVVGIPVSSTHLAVYKRQS